ncbi:MAG: hypothetical protein H6573_26890 [Lewinellaceae bacterium]|nr:hypothetical protein [Lewinellaceae bacterium]
MMKKYSAPAFLLTGLCVILFFSCDQDTTEKELKKGGAAIAMEEWALYRSYPEGRILTQPLTSL